MSLIVHLVLALGFICLSGCDFATGRVSLCDPRLAPMLQAMAASDRPALGFAPIPTNAVVHLNRRPDARRDVELIIYDSAALFGGIRRNIEFRKTATGYEWLREFETHPGPRTFTQSGHKAHEEISINYDTTGISGFPPNKLVVCYHGPVSPIVSGEKLTLDGVRPTLEEWKQKR